MTNEKIATATSNVTNGRSTSSVLNYETGKSRSDLLPGHTYTITGEYVQNNHYKRATDTATLEILKCPTSFTITTSSDTAPIGTTVTISGEVTELQNNTSLQRGTLVFYCDNEVIKTITLSSRNWSFSTSFSTLGDHEIYGIYTDSGVEYNTSTSNTLTITATKYTTMVTVERNSYSILYGDSIIITGRLFYGRNWAIENKPIYLTSHGAILAQTTTLSNGGYTINYTPMWADNNQSLDVVFNGDERYNSSTISITISISKQTSTISSQNMNGETDSTLSIPVTVIDGNNNPISDGTVFGTVKPTICPHTVYYGHIDLSNNSYVCDDIDLIVPASQDLENDAGYVNNDTIILWCYPTEDIQTLLVSITHNGDIIDSVTNGCTLEYDNNGDIFYYETGGNTILVSHIEGTNFTEYNHTTIQEIDGNEFEWTMYKYLSTSSTDTVTVSNGTAILTLDTTDFNEGTHLATITYSGTEVYEGDSGEITLILTKPEWHIIPYYFENNNTSYMQFDVKKGNESIPTNSRSRSMTLTFSDNTTQDILLMRGGQSNLFIFNRIVNYLNYNSYFEQAISGLYVDNDFELEFDPQIFVDAYNDYLENQSE